MRRILPLLLALLWVGRAQAQVDESDLRVFGYFQNIWYYQKTTKNDGSEQKLDSFSVQQLNLFLQRDLARRWTAFINFEALNSYSSLRNWGSFNLEEAWVKYRFGRRLSIKLGQHVPPFNNLNEIKNRTPLLPYIVRPLVYESSFSEFIAIEDYTPARAYAQVYGFQPRGRAKIDYAFYVGNSPEINDQVNHDVAQRGIDVTDNYLVGGRIGLRCDEWKVGLSATVDQVKDAKSYFARIEGDFTTDELDALFAALKKPVGEISRWRWGSDLSFRLGKFSFEGETIHAGYNDNVKALKLDRNFNYATVGYHHSEALFLYASYQTEEDEFTRFDEAEGGIYHVEVDIDLPSVGFAYRLNDRITFKGQYEPVHIDVEFSSRTYEVEDQDLDYVGAAVSIVF
ncbi:MAG: hypothetical protein ACI906_002200 [Candidatus Latescibacterota bacterium]